MISPFHMVPKRRRLRLQTSLGDDACGTLDCMQSQLYPDGPTSLEGIIGCAKAHVRGLLQHASLHNEPSISMGLERFARSKLVVTESHAGGLTFSSVVRQLYDEARGVYSVPDDGLVIFVAWDSSELAHVVLAAHGAPS